jgi:hypothetical protein
MNVFISVKTEGSAGMKQKLSLIGILVLIMEIICLFIPYCFKRRNMKYEDSIIYHGVATLKSKNSVSILDISTPFARILAVVLILSLMITIAGLALPYLKQYKIINYMPLINLALLIIFAYYASQYAKIETVSWLYRWELNWLIYVIIVLQIVVCALAFLIYCETPDKIKIAPVKEGSSEESKGNTQLIKQYKELLDAGVITQEEFEIKKKELLNL